MSNKKITILLFFLIIGVMPLLAQHKTSFQRDTARVNRLVYLAEQYRFTKPDSCLPVVQKALELARSIGFRQGEGWALASAGEYHRVSGNYPEALASFFSVLNIAGEVKDSLMTGTVQTYIGISYIALEEYQKALNYLKQGYAINKTQPQDGITAFGLSNIGVAFMQLKMPDSALVYQRNAWEIGKHMHLTAGKAYVLREMGNVHSELGNYDSAIYYYRYALAISNDVLNSGRIYNRMALLFGQEGKSDSVLYYARLAYLRGQRSFQKPTMLEASRTLAKYYIDHKQPDSAIVYQQLMILLKDSLFGSSQLRKVQLLAIEQQREMYQAQQQQEKYRNRIRLYSLLAASGVFLILGLLLYRNNRRKQRANRLLEQQKNETEKTLAELRAAQAQLIHAEKMASLGELTAGIAHEIQNPLNFVNNFSDVNEELLTEMKDELSKGKIEDAIALANGAIENQKKINHHGKRADAIVKNMLQHSRSSSGVKEPTDLNALAEEYLRLSYHGLRAKDKTFNATMKTDFDESIDNVNIIPQDIGRVLLNLINNAFYVVDEKKKQQLHGYEPTVYVSTRKMNGKVEIKIKDNGNGVPPKVMDKIFQPFFTTKPTGQGTGLGLSLGYDIVKAHGGEIKVNTKEGEGSEFIIQLRTD